MAIALALIGLATLTPVGGARRLSLCIGCGDFALADAVVNIALFVPLGVALGLARVRAGRALVWIVLTTAIVEALQYAVVPGRTASVGDVLANTIGGALGLALPRALVWIMASTARAARAAGATGGAIAIVVAAGLALQANHAPTSVHWTRHGPVLRYGFEPFTGFVNRVDVDGMPVAEGQTRIIARPDSVQLAVTLRSGQLPGQLAEVAQFWTPTNRGWVWIDQRGANLRLHVTSRADGWRLRGHATWLSGALPAVPAESASVTITLRRFQYDVAVAHGANIMSKRVTVSPADGWRLLVPFERQRQRERWSLTLTALWVGALLFPFGLFVQRLSPTALLGGAIGAAIYFAVVPVLTGCAPFPLAGWVGAVGGYAIGAAATAGDWLGRVTAWALGAEVV